MQELPSIVWSGAVAYECEEETKREGMNFIIIKSFPKACKINAVASKGMGVIPTISGFYFNIRM